MQSASSSIGHPWHQPRAALFVTVLAAISTSVTRGQGAEVLRLGAVYDGLKNHPMVEAARAAVRASEARIGPARRWPDPQLQLGLMNRNLPGLGLQDPLGMNTLQIMQMVPVAGKPGQAARVAEARADAARERIADVQWELRSRAAMLFYDLYQAEHTLAIARRSKELLEQLAKTAETMYGAGQGRQSDVLKAQVELARMAGEVVRMEAMQETMRSKLNALLNRPLDTVVPSPALPVFPPMLPPRDSLELLALAGRASLKAGQREVDAADAAVGLARKEIWPDLQIGVQYGQRPMTDGGIDRMVSFMFGASVPIAPGSRQRKMRQEAEAMREMASADLNALRADTRGRLGELYAEALRARALVLLYHQTILPQADANAASVLNSYRVGAVEFMTLLDAQMSGNSYRQELAQLEAEEGKALAELEMLTAHTLVDPSSVAQAEGNPQ